MTVHVYGPTKANSFRTRALCPDPQHRKLSGAMYTLYYDGWRVAFDCGSFYDGEGGYFGHRGPRGGHGPRRQLPRKVWKQWPHDAWKRRTWPILQEYLTGYPMPEIRKESNDTD